MGRNIGVAYGRLKVENKMLKATILELKEQLDKTAWKAEYWENKYYEDIVKGEHNNEAKTVPN